ncbi:MAG: hypothetical protein NXI24_10790 [bacterium]|nr:hypothetical protein [bacterium]
MARQRSLIPSYVLIARALKRHRGNSSYLFMIWWGLVRPPRRASSDALPPVLVRTLGFLHRDLRQITGLYRGLKRELGQVKAAAACIDIVHTLRKHGKARKFK